MQISYLKDTFQNALSNGLDDNLRQLAEDDSKLLNQLGVSDERQRNLVFYLDHFLDDFCEEMNLKVPEDRQGIIAKAFAELKGAKNVDLADIKCALYRAMGGKRAKLAYPNVSGVMGLNARPQRDVEKWVKVLGEIHAAEQQGTSGTEALKSLTEEWDPVEKLDFQQWMRYYEHGDHEKYAAPESQTPVEQVPFSGRQPRRMPEDRSIEENRRALISRLDSAKKLLRLFAPPIWPQDRWNSVYRALSDLEQEITSLRTTASMRDRIIRTANLLQKIGFEVGSDNLRKIAQPPEEDVASQIERALTGKQSEPAAAPLPLEEPPALPPPPPEGEIMPDKAPEGAPPEAMEQLPEPPPPPTPEPEKKPKDENPYAGSTTQDILDILDPLMKRMKERDTVRLLTKVDMMMDALGIVSYFPELGEAIGRMLENDSYVGTRIEKIISKLRSGGKEEEKKEKKEPPSIEMDMGAKAPAPSPTEEVATTVTEPTPPPEVIK